ncbi:MAG: spore germination protein [Paenibacillus sp.]|nr:spore germination protein [Paenibacillus sp.]
MYSIASMILGMGVLTLPRNIANSTRFFDGWISIALAGTASLVMVWILSSLTSSFPKRTFFEYVSLITSKPVGYVMTGLFSSSYLLFTAYEIRSLAEVAKQYLFNKTPIEFIALFFWLVIIYAVAGSRVGLLRLNLLFFPIVAVVLSLVLFLNVGLIEPRHFKPMFVSDWRGIAKGAQNSGFSFLGFEIVLVYAVYLKKPEQAVKAAVTGTLIPFFVYLVLYLFVIGVFSYSITKEIDFPTIELAKEVEVPGAFFERFESFFFTIWIMTIFNTTAMAFDVSLFTLHQILPGIGKMTKIHVLAPLIYMISFYAQDSNELDSFGLLVSILIVICCVLLPTLIFIAAKWRRVKPNG